MCSITYTLLRHYLHMFHSVPKYLYTTHCEACLYTICVYGFKLPKYLLHRPPIKGTSTTYSCTSTAHVGLLLLGTFPRPHGRGGDHLAGAGAWRSLLKYTYTHTYSVHTYIHTQRYIYIYIYVHTYLIGFIHGFLPKTSPKHERLEGLRWHIQGSSPI